MLSVAIANATVQHLVKEEGDVATRAERRLLPEEFRGGFTLDIPRRLKKNSWSHSRATRFPPQLAGRYSPPTASRRTGRASFHPAPPLAADLA